MSEPKPTAEDAERFWEKVAVGYEDECWWWLGAQDERGVGQFWLSGQVVRAPRLAWSIYNNKPFPDELFACHRCDNACCCNPAHIWPDTHQANVDDMTGKLRHPHGETHGASKITEEQVREIRALSEQGQLSQGEIGQKYGLSKWQVSNIVRKLQWGHVT